MPRENTLKDMLKLRSMHGLGCMTVDVAVSEVDIRASGALAVLILLILVPRLASAFSGIYSLAESG